MFVVSLKTTRPRLLATAACAVLALSLFALLLIPSAPVQSTATAATTEAEQLTYLRSLGYTAESTPLSVEEIALPDTLDATLEKYNTLQQQAGFDLSLYGGQRVKCWTYTVTDNAGNPATAHLYVYEGRLIGGDITDSAGNVRALQKLQQED